MGVRHLSGGGSVGGTVIARRCWKVHGGSLLLGGGHAWWLGRVEVTVEASWWLWVEEGVCLVLQGAMKACGGYHGGQNVAVVSVSSEVRHWPKTVIP